MAIKLIANYSKRLGLPGYSSHQFSVSVETEVTTTESVASEAERLYHSLQCAVDEQMLQTGFVPPADYGMEPSTDGKSNAVVWRCSDKQKDLILKLVDEHKLDKNEVDHLARQRFGKGVRELNKVEASGLIDELLETHGGKQRAPRSQGRNGTAYSGSKGKGRAA